MSVDVSLAAFAVLLTLAALPAGATTSAAPSPQVLAAEHPSSEETTGWD